MKARASISLAMAILLLDLTDCHAMHIAEGILPLSWSVIWYLVAIPFVALGLFRIRENTRHNPSFKPLVGLSSALVFVISCMPIPVPVAGTCSHPCGVAISAILLGPFASTVVAFVALLIQALFLAHGGLSTLGANTLSMGVMGSFAGFGAFALLRAMKLPLWVGAILAGLLADWATYLTTSVELALGIKGEGPFMPLFTKVLVAFIPTQLPLGILEGFMTLGVVSLLHRRRPELITSLGLLRAREVRI